MRELGRRIRRARTGRYTQAELARRVDRTHGWLSAIENGKGGDVPAEVLTALAVELGEDPQDFLRLAGRTVLQAEGIVPAPALDPRVAAAIESAVERSMDRLGDRLEVLLRELLPGGGR